jgi:hypothetical protein
MPKVKIIPVTPNRFFRRDIVFSNSFLLFSRYEQDFMGSYRGSRVLDAAGNGLVWKDKGIDFLLRSRVLYDAKATSRQNLDG